MDFYPVITAKIDHFYQQMKSDNPFFRAIFSGELQPTQWQAYLENVKVSLATNIKHIKMSAELAAAQGMPLLQEYYENKIAEEVGHDEWAASDLAALGQQFTLDTVEYPLEPNLALLIANNEKALKQDPRLFLVYILFAEYLTVVAGPECTESIAQRCGINKESLSVITKHAELDKDHVAEWREEVHSCQIDLSGLSEQVFAFLEETMSAYNAFAAGLVLPRGTHA